MLGLLDPDLLEDLAVLRSYRNTADYDLHITMETLVLEHADALQRAEHVRELLDNLQPPEPDPAAENYP